LPNREFDFVGQQEAQLVFQRVPPGVFPPQVFVTGAVGGNRDITAEIPDFGPFSPARFVLAAAKSGQPRQQLQPHFAANVLAVAGGRIPGRVERAAQPAADNLPDQRLRLLQHQALQRIVGSRVVRKCAH
jgi:hypothetical protein